MKDEDDLDVRPRARDARTSRSVPVIDVGELIRASVNSRLGTDIGTTFGPKRAGSSSTPEI